MVLGFLATVVSLTVNMNRVGFNFWLASNSAAPSDFNWAVACFFAILAGSLVLYVIRARKVYTGPVVLVEGRGRVL